MIGVDIVLSQFRRLDRRLERSEALLGVRSVLFDLSPECPKSLLHFRFQASKLLGDRFGSIH